MVGSIRHRWNSSHGKPRPWPSNRYPRQSLSHHTCGNRQRNLQTWYWRLLWRLFWWWWCWGSIGDSWFGFMFMLQFQLIDWFLQQVNNSGRNVSNVRKSNHTRSLTESVSQSVCLSFLVSLRSLSRSLSNHSSQRVSLWWFGVASLRMGPNLS